jgi:hypothetical protein
MSFWQVLQWLLRNPEVLVAAFVIGGPIVGAIGKRIKENAQRRANAIRAERERLEELRTGRPSAGLADAPMMPPVGATTASEAARTEGQPTTLVRLPGGIVIELPTPPNSNAPGAPGSQAPQARPVPRGPFQGVPRPQQRQPQGGSRMSGAPASRGPRATTMPSRVPVSGDSGRAGVQPGVGVQPGAPSGMSQGGMIAQQQRQDASGQRDARQRQIENAVASQAREARREENAKKRVEQAAREKERLEREREDQAAMAAAFANPTERAADAQSKRAAQAGTTASPARRASGATLGVIAGGMSREELRRALIMQELLGPPASLRENAGTWQPPG